jgi:protein involved in polysaccharide export with SLBB domain
VGAIRRLLTRLATTLLAIQLALVPAQRAMAQSGDVLILPDYKVGVGDRLKVIVYNADRLSGEFLVGGDGKIAMPILGRVQVGGLTLDGIAELLEAELGNGYLNKPNVTVDMIAYRSVYVLGEVQRPGQYPYVEGMTVFQLVAQAGGFTYRANRKTVKLRHEGEVAETKYTMFNASEVRPGDTVVILERFF